MAETKIQKKGKEALVIEPRDGFHETFVVGSEGGISGEHIKARKKGGKEIGAYP